MGINCIEVCVRNGSKHSSGIDCGECTGLVWPGAMWVL